MKNIAIIGAGELGSRHFQALKKMQMDANIWICDPIDKSISVCKARYDEIKENDFKKSVHYLKNITGINSPLDLCIVACNSDVRKKVVEQILNVTTIKNFLLEKILFQKIEDYKKIENLFEQTRVKAWVNCPMRTWPVYKFLKSELEKTELIEINVKGSNWGMGTSLIHYIDVVCFLSGISNYQIDTTLLDRTFTESKRKGFVDITGTVQGITESNIRFSISSYREGTQPIAIEVVTESQIFLIIEKTGKVVIIDKSNKLESAPIYF